MSQEILEYISRRKKEINAMIMAHFYQPPEIQDVADFVGDSLELARLAAVADADVIILCGVSFMAESAKILNPSKTVILPEPTAGCPMADMVTGAALRDKKAQFPNAVVVSYVNTSAEVKAESDVCCTSSNAIAVVNSIPNDQQILFVPDRNLGSYIARQTGRDMILWEGCCPIHDQVSREQVEEQKRAHPGVPVVVHPECPPDVTLMADAVLSTAGIIQYVGSRPEPEFIIGTEEGLLYKLQKTYPDKRFYLARSDFRCQDMKSITLPVLARSMETLEHQVEVPEDIRIKADQALQRMLAIK
ncbi:MAG: quinolinate synthase NadA [Syntrophomonadaceae bacterium]|nr:quinolinate synthase NadA [Syntrophomonadaceae bacterium]